MDGETAGSCVYLACCWATAAVFMGLAFHARRTDRPVSFWAGMDVDPKTVTDVPAYNRANARMWAWYSVPYWISGLLFPWSSAAALILLLGAGFPGSWLLYSCYRKIETKYIRDPKKIS